MTTEASYLRPGGSLGSTIEEKTRNLLGWTEADHATNCAQPLFSSAFCTLPSQPQIVKPGSCKKDRSRKPKAPQRSAPYPYSLVPEGRSRKSSISSVSSSSSTSGESVLKQQLTPPPSPSPASTTTTLTSNANVTIVSLPRTAQTRMAIPTETQRNSSSMDSYGSLPISPVSPSTPNPYSILSKAVYTPSPNAPSQQVFERIRELIPDVPTDNNAYKILVQTATSVIELEHKLQNIIQEKEKYKSMLESRRHSAPAIPSPLPLNQSNCRLASLASPAFPSNPILSASLPSRKISPLPNTVSQPFRSPWEHPLPSWNVPEDLAQVDVSAFKHLVASPSNQDSGNSISNVSRSSGGNWDMLSGSFPFDLDPLTVDTAPSTAALYC